MPVARTTKEPERAPLDGEVGDNPPAASENAAYAPWNKWQSKLLANAPGSLDENVTVTITSPLASITPEEGERAKTLELNAAADDAREEAAAVTALVPLTIECGNKK